MRITRLGVDEWQEHGELLIRNHYEEVARNKSVMKLDPDWDRYQKLEDEGWLFGLGAWVETPKSNQLVGYSFNIIGPHLHYSSMRYAQNDVLFVLKEARRSRIGLQLIYDTEREARSRGATLMLWHAKQHTTLERLMPRLGYQVQDIIYSKVI